MGCDIHSFVEVRPDDRWVRSDAQFQHYPDYASDAPFFHRSYSYFGFLADVRNYSHSPVIADPRGLPDDSTLSPDDVDYALDAGHSHSWLMLAELLAYDYDQVFWDRRVTRDGNGAALAEEGEGEHLTLRAFLGEWFFETLAALGKLGAPEDVRIVFWFDS